MPGRQVTPPGHLTFEIYRAFARRQPLQHLQVVFRENKKSGVPPFSGWSTLSA
jgi:hypothetical protein